MMLQLTVALLFWAGLLMAGGPADWVPARWEGGPAELARRAKDRPVNTDPAVRAAIAGWYDPATLDLLEGTPINCLLVTLAADAEQQRLVKEYGRLARERGIAVLGLVRPGEAPAAIAGSVLAAQLDGVVLEGEFAPGFAEAVRSALRDKQSPALVIPIAASAAPLRTSSEPLIAVEGLQPNSRHPMEDGVRATPTTEPWIESNIWLARSFRLGTAWRPLWINQGPKPGPRAYYLKSAADAAAAGARWIVALDDELRAKLFRKDPEALATWRILGTYLQFPEDHSEWRNWTPYGNLGIILDTAGEYPDISNEYLNLVARRQIPYRVIQRSQLTSAALADLQAVLAADLAPPSEVERTLLTAFAENGGLVVAGPSWGDAPKSDPYTELKKGKGRIAIYKDDPPEPDAVARGFLDLLEPEVIGITTFNVPSVLTYASTSGQRLLVQLVNYADRPSDARITIRVNGRFKTARLFTPENPPVDLALEAAANGRTQFAILKLGMWGAVLLE